MKLILKRIVRFCRRVKNTFKFIRIPNQEAKRALRDACPKLRIEIAENASIRIGTPCFTNEENCSISARENAQIEIGGDVFFNKNCTIVAREKVTIESDCLFGPNVYICDHDHVFDTENLYTDKFKTAPISIGRGTWIGAGCIILKGAIIGKNCIIGAGSVITGTIPDGMIVLQKRNNTMYERKSNI